MFEWIVRIVIYASSVFISVKYANDYWVVGPVFGLAVVSWDSSNFRNFVALKHLSFLASSAVIYALVYHISIQNWDRGSDFLDSTTGSLPIAVVIGSVLLPLAHRLFLSATHRSVTRTVVLLVAGFYAVTLVSWANDTWSLGWNVNFLAVSVAVWQGLYLFSFFFGGREGAPAA